VIKLITPKNNSYIPAGTEIRFDIYDTHLLYANYSIDGGDQHAFDQSNKIETTGWLDGPYDIEVYAEDMAGNNISVALTFNLDSTSPSVTGTYPIDDKDGVLTNTSIWVKFSEVMNETSVSNAISISPSVLFTLDWSLDHLSLILTPLSNLANATKYTVRINTTAKDLAGNTLLNDLVFSFTTGPDEEDEDPGLWWRILFILSVLILALLLYFLIFKKKKRDAKDEEPPKGEEDKEALKKEPEKEEGKEKEQIKEEVIKGELEKKSKVRERPKPPPPKKNMEKKD
jgi:hypothetical protein